MKDHSKLLVELSRISYIAAAKRTVESQEACARACKEQMAREAKLDRCTDQRRRLSQALSQGGCAGALRLMLTCDGILLNQSDRLADHLDRAARAHIQAATQLSDCRQEAKREFQRLRLAEKLRGQKNRARRRVRERRQEEEALDSARY